MAGLQQTGAHQVEQLDAVSAVGVQTPAMGQSRQAAQRKAQGVGRSDVPRPTSSSRWKE